MFSVTINAASAAELGAAAAALANAFNTPSAGAQKVLSAAQAENLPPRHEGGLPDAEARRIAAGTATVSTPKAETAAAKKARLAAEAAAAETAAADEPAVDEVDPLGDAPAAADEVTLEDVRAALVEMKEARTDKPTIVADIVKEFGVARLNEIPAEKFAAVLARAKAEIAKKKK